MKLKDAAIRAFEPTDKVVKLLDGGSFFLLVHPSGMKTRVYAYRFDGKQKKLTLGHYPQVSLKKARDAGQDTQGLLRSGHRPRSAKAGQQAREYTLYIFRNR